MIKASVTYSFCLLLCLATGLAGDGPRFWTNKTMNDFLSGKAEGVSILAEEELTLAPEIKLLLDSGEPFIWSVVNDKNGVVYASTGHDGRVFKISFSGDTTTVYDALEPEVTALAIDNNENLYIGASPDGRVYRLPKGESQAETFFDPEEKYIWDMAFSANGDLYLAVGSRGRIYRVDRQGNGRIVLDSEEQHIISLELDRNGNLLAGSSGNALLYQITPDGSVSILYDSQLKDIKSIVVDSQNNLFVAAFEVKSPMEQTKSLMPQSSIATDKPDDSNEPNNGDDSQSSKGFILKPAPQPMGPSFNSEIYYFDSDRFVTRLWQGSGEAVMSLGLTKDDKALFVSKKEKNNLFSVDNRGQLTLMNSFEECDVTGFLRLNNRMLICSGNPGKIFEISDNYVAEGTFTSSVLNAGLPAKWGRLSWEGEISAGTQVSFRTRSGNTSRPDTTWSSWSEPLKRTQDAPVMSPPKRHLQWQATLKSNDRRKTPRISEITVSYLRRNRPPMISAIRFMPQGLFIKSSDLTEEKSRNKNVYPYEVEELLNNKKSSGTDNPFQGKKEYEKKLRMAGWNANDPNGDDLLYSVHYRGISETVWRPLSENNKENSVIFDTESMADGKYLLRVTAHDSLSNPEDRAESSKRISPVFTVDNTPPVIGDLKADNKSIAKGLTLSFTVSDKTSRIELLEVTLDAGSSRQPHPEDEIQDSLEESYRIEWKNLLPGEHTVTIQAYDRFFNMVTVRKTISIE